MPIVDDFQDNTPAPTPTPKKRRAYGTQEMCAVAARTYRERKLASGLCVSCGIINTWHSSTRCVPCAKKHREQSERRKTSSQYRREMRDRVFAHYGWVSCCCCGEQDGRFLTIDHINNDGWAHRGRLGKRAGSYSVLLSIIREGFPAAYQCLCFNCNLGKAKNGGVCPHKEAVYANK